MSLKFLPRHFTSKYVLSQIAAGIRKGYWNGLFVVKSGTQFVLGAFRRGVPFLIGKTFKLQRDAVSFAEERYGITPDKATLKLNAAVA